MSIIMIGSRAANNIVDGFRELPSDYDLIASVNDLKDITKIIEHDTIKDIRPQSNGRKMHFTFIKGGQPIHVEVELIDKSDNTNCIHDYVVSRPHSKQSIGGVEIFYPSLDVLLMLKMSHRFKRGSVHFEKTHKDIMSFMEMNVTLNDDLKLILKNREKETYTQKKFILDTSKESFFVDTFYIYDHDSIHEAVARREYPAYKDFQRDGSEVMCSREMFEALEFERKLDAVIEESCVLALERAIIPHKTDVFIAYRKALQAICTGTTSGWFREFAWNNYFVALNRFDNSFVEKFDIALANGKIRPFK